MIKTIIWKDRSNLVEFEAFVFLPEASVHSGRFLFRRDVSLEKEGVTAYEIASGLFEPGVETLQAGN